jgi:dTMP kinase
MADQKTIPGGLVIIFEGLDGVGKTTQVKLAYDTLVEAGWKTHISRNMGGTPIGEELRKVIFSLLPRPALTDLYIGAAVQEALAVDIEERRREGQVILLDRGPMSFAAYPSYGGELDKELAWKHADAGYNYFKPELIIFYRLGIDKAKARVGARNEAKNYFEEKPKDFFERVLMGLQEGAERYNAKSLSADDSIENVHANTMNLIEKLL